MKNKLLRLFLSLGLMLGVLLPTVPASAAGASITLTANKSTVASGSSVIIAVYMNGGGNPVNAVEADLAYPASQLQYVGFSASGSAFEIGASSGGGGGLATLDRGTTGAVTGSGLVGTVTFRALVGSGSASISVAGSSALVSGGNPVAYGSSGVNLHFGAEVAGSSGSKAAAAPAAPKDTTPPVITLVKPTGVTPFGATITWTTNEPSSSVVEYGLDTTYGLSASSAALTTTHSVALSSAFLNPLTLLHYHVKSTDGAGNVATGTDQTLELPGVTVTIVVLGPSGKPQPGATVTVDNATGTTDAKGTVTLPTSLGKHQVTSSYQGVTNQKPIVVTKSVKPLPPIQLDLSKQPVNPWALTSIGLFVVVLTLLAIDGFLFGSRFFGKLAGLHFPKPHMHMPEFPGHGRATIKPATAPLPAAPITSPPPTQNRPAMGRDVKPPEPSPPPPPPAPPAETDPEKAVAELMGEPALTPDADTDPKADTKKESKPAEEPLKAPIQQDVAPPPPPKITHIAPSAPSLPDLSTALPSVDSKPADKPVDDKAANVAKRLKKPSTKAKKPKPITKKPSK